MMYEVIEIHEKYYSIWMKTEVGSLIHKKFRFKTSENNERFLTEKNLQVSMNNLNLIQ